MLLISTPTAVSTDPSFSSCSQGDSALETWEVAALSFDVLSVSRWPSA